VREGGRGREKRAGVMRALTPAPAAASPLEVHPPPVAAVEEELAEGGHDGARPAADHRVVVGDVAPAEDVEPLAGGEAGDAGGRLGRKSVWSRLR
jgi:hypothetical protein